MSNHEKKNPRPAIDGAFMPGRPARADRTEGERGVHRSGASRLVRQRAVAAIRLRVERLVVQRAQRFAERVTRLFRRAARQVADRRLRAFALRGDLRLA